MVTGLQYLHDFGVIHRNVHGRNVLITQDRRAKIADYTICPQLKYFLLPPEVIIDKSQYSEKSDILYIL